MALLYKPYTSKLCNIQYVEAVWKWKQIFFFFPNTVSFFFFSFLLTSVTFSKIEHDRALGSVSLLWNGGSFPFSVLIKMYRRGKQVHVFLDNNLLLGIGVRENVNLARTQEAKK